MDGGSCSWATLAETWSLDQPREVGLAQLTLLSSVAFPATLQLLVSIDALTLWTFFPSICRSFHPLSFPRPAPSIAAVSSVLSSLLSECGEDEKFILKPSVPQDAPPVTQTV